MALLRRLGGKAALMKDLLPHFPEHDIFIEPFFGAGGCFFNKPRARINLLNDNDSEVSNLWMVIKERREDFRREMEMAPVHMDLWNHWKKVVPEDPVMKAVRFVFFSNFGYMGKPHTLHLLADSRPKQVALDAIEAAFVMLGDTKFANMDFRKFLGGIVLRSLGSVSSAFIYNDPPYLGTENNYQSGFTERDSRDLIEANIKTGCRFAMSEFDNPVILALAEEYGLNVVTIGERKNMKNRRVEILLTNYPSPASAAAQGNLFLL